MLEGSNGLPKDVVEPPKFITARHVAAIFEKLGFDASCGTKVFGVLCEALSRVDGTVMEAGEEEGEEEVSSGRQSEAAPREGFSGKNNNDLRASETEVGAVSLKMDVKAFIRAAEMDDILLQVSVLCECNVMCLL